MSFTLNILFIAAPSPSGQELYSMFKSLLESKTIDHMTIHLEFYDQYDPMYTLKACFCYDLIVFDASIESENDLHYNCITELHKNSPYCLVVSRTIIPVNFYGCNKGAYPEHITRGLVAYKASFSNAEILTWLKTMIFGNRLILPNPHKISAGEYDRLCQESPEQLFELEKSIMTQKVDDDQKIFISYLSRYSRHYTPDFSNSVFIEDLINEISSNSTVNPENIQYIPPGRFSHELMIEQQKWVISSIIGNFIYACDEFWILNTPDYLSSWWTISELFSLLHEFHGTGNCPNIVIATPQLINNKIRFDIKRLDYIDKKLDYLPKLSDYELRELTRLIVNTRPETAGYESAKLMGAIAKMPKLLIKAHMHFVKKLYAQLPLDEKDDNIFSNPDLYMETISFTRNGHYYIWWPVRNNGKIQINPSGKSLEKVSYLVICNN